MRSVATVCAVLFIGFVSTLSGFASVQHRWPWQVATQPIPPPQQLFGKRNLRVLVIGLDYDYNSNDIEYSTHSRSDIIMAVNFDFTHRRINELSIPRDMVATLPNGQQAKINQAQSDGGVAESQSVISHWLGVPGFDRYVVLRIDTTKDLIDALGGINLNVENSDALRHTGPNGPIDYDDSWGHLHVHLRPGLQHLSGDQAVGYARFRHDWCSDPCRIMRQQQVMRAIVGKLEQNKVNTLMHLSDLIGVANRDISTNFSTIEELSLASAYAGVSPRSVRAAQVPYTADVYLPGYGDSIVADEQKKAQLVKELLGDPAP